MNAPKAISGARVATWGEAAMELTAVKGLGPTTIKALRKAGIRDVESLALVDVRRKRVPGIPREKLQILRKGAQRTIYQSAAKRIKKIVRETRRTVTREAHQVERLVRDATFSVLLAAKTAQERAAQARDAAQQRATVLAHVAADRARAAAQSAEREYQRILRNLRRVPKGRRTVLNRYAEKAEFAKHAAAVARERAAQAARWARASVQEGRRSLFDRLQSRANGRA